MSKDLCPVCLREVVEVLAAADVPLPFNIEPSGHRWHRGCVEDYVLPSVRLSGGALGALRVQHAARLAPSKRMDIFTDDEEGS